MGKSLELKDKRIGLYGLGTETERFIKIHGNELEIVGLLDGYKERGEQFGYPILSLQQAVELGVEVVLVIARPGSCKVIAKRIKDICIANGILVYDVRGNNLLVERHPLYEFTDIPTYTKNDLLNQIDEADVISFDLFDTLINRKISDYTDVFELVANQIGVKAIPYIRIAAEKELSRDSSPTLVEIYNLVKKELPEIKESAKELATIEWQIDAKTMAPRTDMRDITIYAKNQGKKTILTSDSYYSKKQLKSLLEKFQLDVFDELFVSCEYGTFKTQNLFEKVKEAYKGKKILHIGNDDLADVEKARLFGIKPFQIYGSNGLLDALGGMGIEPFTKDYSDRAKLGLFLSRLFSSPF